MLLDLAGGAGDISFGWLRRERGPAIYVRHQPVDVADQS